MRAKILVSCLVVVGGVAFAMRGRGGAESKRIAVSKVTPKRTLAVLPKSGEGTSPHWPQFRGSGAAGFAEGHTTPVEWDVATSKNIRWRTPVSGLGHSSPVIWGDRLYITTAISGEKDPELRVGLYGQITSVEDDTSHEWKVLCLDKNSGKVLWESTVHQGVPKVKRHTKATHANSTPATDGKHVVAFFGSEGLYCFDLDGKLLWKKDLGVLNSAFFAVPEAQWGFASSPIIYDNMIMLQCDVLTDSFLAAFNVEDGSEVWRTPRKDVPTWSTPSIYEGGERTQVIANGFEHIGGYDLKTGALLWNMSGGGDIPVPTPVIGRDLIFITSAHGPQAPIYAIRTSATGDVSLQGSRLGNEHVAWSAPGGGNYMQTPLLYGEYLYCCRDNGSMRCREADTGKTRYSKRLGNGRTGFTASAVAADGKLYFTSEEGTVFVVKAGPLFGKMAQNELGEVCLATPAISQGALFFRTKHHVVAVAESK